MFNLIKLRFLVLVNFRDYAKYKNIIIRLIGLIQ